MLSSDAEYADNGNRGGFDGMQNNEGMLNPNSASENELNNRDNMAEYDQSFNNKNTPSRAQIEQY